MSIPVSRDVQYILGNWKMAQSLRGAREFLRSWKAPEKEKQICTVYCSYPHLWPVLEAISQGVELLVGAQDVSSHKPGAFTGEVSAVQLAELNVGSCLVGHSERRQYFSESNELLKLKVEQLLAQKITPVFCIGENLEQRKSGKTLEVLAQQLDGFQSVLKNCVVAYEPVWAIGTGEVATLDQIQEAHQFLCEKTPGSPIVYGGSVKPENASEILGLPEVHGVLVGGASLKAESFFQIAAT